MTFACACPHVQKSTLLIKNMTSTSSMIACIQQHSPAVHISEVLSVFSLTVSCQNVVMCPLHYIYGLFLGNLLKHTTCCCEGCKCQRLSSTTKWLNIHVMYVDSMWNADMLATYRWCRLMCDLHNRGLEAPKAV